MKSTLVLERAVRGMVVLRDGLAFDTRFAAAVPGKPDKVGHVFLLVEGRFVLPNGETLMAPVGFVLADEEIERVDPTLGSKSRWFRTDGDRVHVMQFRFDRKHLHAPVGLDAGPLKLTAATWDAMMPMREGAPRGDASVMVRFLEALASSNVISRDVASTIIPQEPDNFARLWSALTPLYQEYGGTTSLKQIASHLDMSMRQVGRDAKELTKTFGLGGGFRDMLLVLRLRVAALLLSAPEATVADVARCVGYGSPIAMARAFRDAKLPAPSAIQDAMRSA
jgi:AraC-like DNA-binding protein